MTAIGKKKVEGLRGVISFAGFASYQDMARRVAGDVGTELVTDELSARDFVSKIAPVPLLIVHGTRDGTVPLSQADLLFQKAKKPRSYFKIVGGGHNRALSDHNGKYQKKILLWISGVLK